LRGKNPEFVYHQATAYHQWHKVHCLKATDVSCDEDKVIMFMTLQCMSIFPSR